MNQRKAGAVLSYVHSLTTAIVGFIYIPLLIYFLGKEEYGLYQLLGSILIYLSLFDMGLSSTVTRYYSKYLALKDKMGQENLLAISAVLYGILSLVLLGVGIVFYFFLEDVFGRSLSTEQLESAKIMYVVIVGSAVITVFSAVFNSTIASHEKFVFLKVIAISQTLARPLLVLLVFTFESSALIVVIVQAFINLMGALFKIYYTFFKLKIVFKYHYWDTPLIKEMFVFSFFIFVTMLMDQLFWRSDQLLLGALSGTAAVAIYSVAAQIVLNFQTFSTAISGVFLPNVTKMVIEGVPIETLSKLFVKIGRIQMLLLGLLMAGFILLGKNFIELWVGEGFDDAYYITLLIMIPFTLDLIQNIGLTILQAKNMYSFRAVVFFLMAVAKVAFSIPLITQWGGVGAAAATGVAFLIGNGIIMNWYYAKKVKLDILWFWKEMTKIVVAIIPLTILTKMVFSFGLTSPLLDFLIKGGLFTLVYLMVMWLFVMNSYEKDVLRSVRKKLLKV